MGGLSKTLITVPALDLTEQRNLAASEPEQLYRLKRLIERG